MDTPPRTGDGHLLDHNKDLETAKPKVPFLPVRVDWALVHPSYPKMIFQIFSPHFNFRSVTFVLLLTTALCLVVPQFFYTPTDYLHFLAKTNIPGVYLHPEAVRSNTKNLYQCFTTMFFHANYLHYVRSMLIIFLKMAPLEYIWPFAPYLAVFNGFIVNCYVALFTNSQFIGFTGAVASTIGMYAGFLVVNWSYLTKNYNHMIKPWVGGCIAVTIMFLGGSSWKYLSVHLVSMMLGLYVGIGFLPKYSNTTQ